MIVTTDITAAVTAMVADIAVALAADRAADRAAEATAILTTRPAAGTAVDDAIRAARSLAAAREADVILILEVVELFVRKGIPKKETHGSSSVRRVINSRV